jgi:hypothetical protein
MNQKQSLFQKEMRSYFDVVYLIPFTLVINCLQKKSTKSAGIIFLANSFTAFRK